MTDRNIASKRFYFAWGHGVLFVLSTVLAIVAGSHGSVRGAALNGGIAATNLLLFIWHVVT